MKKTIGLRLSTALLTLLGCSTGPTDPNQSVVQSYFSSADTEVSIVRSYGTVRSDDQLAATLAMMKSRADRAVETAELLITSFETVGEYESVEFESAKEQLHVEEKRRKKIVEAQVQLPFEAYRMTYYWAGELCDSLFIIHRGEVTAVEDLRSIQRPDSLFKEFVERSFP